MNEQDNTVVKTETEGRKKNPVLVAVIVAAGVALIIAVIAISGTFDAVFAELLAGEETDGMYMGGSLELECEGADASFVGIYGDNDAASGLLRFTAQDGKDFVDKYKDCYIIYDWEDGGMYAGRRKNLVESILGKTSNPPIITAEYSFEDNKNIMLEFRYYGFESDNPKGKTIELSCGEITAVRPVETVFTPDLRNDLAQYYFDSGGNLSWYYPDTLVNALRAEYSDKLSDNMDIVCSEDGNSLVLAEVRKISLDYRFSVKMNYRSKGDAHFDSIEIKDDEDVAWKIKRIEAHPMTLELAVGTDEARKLDMPSYPNNYSGDPAEEENSTANKEYDILVARYDKAYEDLFRELEITLRDGSTIRAAKADAAYSSIIASDINSINMHNYYFYYKDDRQISIDPSEIKEISHKGIRISA